MRGLNGTHGVIIPKQNVHNLNLSDEVIEAVKMEIFIFMLFLLLKKELNY